MKKQINKSFFTVFKETLHDLANPDVITSYEINAILKKKGFSDYFFQTGNTAVAFRRLGYENDGYRSKTWVKSQFKLRASASGKLATAPRNKSETLSETTKSYLKEWAIEQLYGIKNQITSKYIDRGIQDEDLAINKAIEVLDLPFSLKNEQQYEDDFFTGTPDLIIHNCVLDIKTSWSCFTFPIFEREIPTKDYFYQLQIYMHLLNVPKAKLVYVLLDNESIDHFYPSDSPRIKIFDIDYDSKVIEDLKEKVKEARIYLKNLI